MAEQEQIEFNTIMVVGLGLIGGSICMALRDSNTTYMIIGVSPRQETIDKALEQGLINQGYTIEDPTIDQMLASGSIDLVMLTMPPQHALTYFKRLERAGYTGVITDAASTKSNICAEASAVLHNPSKFIPGHPMAGREVNGLEGAAHGLFSCRYWILCPDENTDTRAFMALHSLVTSLGAKCISLPRGAHDDMVAVISHVPHVVASALVELATRHADDGDELFRLAAGGFRDTTRIAAGSPRLWADIIMSNRTAISKDLHQLCGILSNVEQMVCEGNTEGIREFLSEASFARKNLPTANGPVSERLLKLYVALFNRVGAVAEVTAIAGRCGCNIQSIDIDHITDETAMLELVFTEEGDMQGLITSLEEMGYLLPLGDFEEVHQ